jgi:hypothetical protein
MELCLNSRVKEWAKHACRAIRKQGIRKIEKSIRSDSLYPDLQTMLATIH